MTPATEQAITDAFALAFADDETAATLIIKDYDATHIGNLLAVFSRLVRDAHEQPSRFAAIVAKYGPPIARL